ncbi:MAG TPA: gamma-glutamylcyclotransferase family protein [Vicinamibacterales bacterium]|jgi:gamma-glutamylcyclotransferase (GGCT)/AIG2-like uncharacterized protein YtfP|nr:gamma-glutamylcyclotransferase family protein [Vicinamibacterales bacterium]
MPQLFSYGSLQESDVQLPTFGRLLSGQRDELLGAQASTVKIENPEIVAALGRTHHANVTLASETDARVPGTVFEISDSELKRVDAYEAVYSYRRVLGRLASGTEAWVYVYTDACGAGEGC